MRRETPPLNQASPPDPRTLAAALGNVMSRTSRPRPAPALMPRDVYEAEVRQREQEAAAAALQRLRQANAAAAESAAPPAAELVDQVRIKFESWELAEWIRVRQAEDAARQEEPS